MELISGMPWNIFKRVDDLFIGILGEELKIFPVVFRTIPVGQHLRWHVPYRRWSRKCRTL